MTAKKTFTVCLAFVLATISALIGLPPEVFGALIFIGVLRLAMD